MAAFISSAVHAASLDLYDLAISTSSGVTGDWQDLAANDPTMLAGVTTTMVCCDSNGGPTPGIGNYSYTFTGAPGTYHATLYFNYDIALPITSEYGIVNNGGAAPSGISYEIFNYLSTTGNIVLYGANGVADGETYGTADGLNHVGAGNDANVGMALTYTFTLGANQEAVISANSSTSNPGGFSLETVADDGSGNTVYLNGGLSIQPININTGAPEPSTWGLLAAGSLMVGLRRIRSFKKS